MILNKTRKLKCSMFKEARILDSELLKMNELRHGKMGLLGSKTDKIHTAKLVKNSDKETRCVILSRKRTTKALIRRLIYVFAVRIWLKDVTPI